ncbi:MAG: phosphatase PAP2 family protein [Actinomyces sp.]|nr:MAG: phosphatase PAP2 family protein [Actinomyces sp.]
MAAVTTDTEPRRHTPTPRPRHLTVASAAPDADGSGESLRRVAAGLAVQFGLVLAAALAYFGVRGLTEGSEVTAVDHAGRLLELEARLGLDLEAGLQGWALTHPWLVTLANWIYIWGHWPVIAAVLVWAYRRHRSAYFTLRNAMFVSGAIGLVIFAAYPVAPPRLMPGFVDTVTEHSHAYRVLQPPQLVNRFAAMPSLHVGWNLLVGVIVYRTAAHRLARALGAAIPFLMASAVVLTANHYLLDAVVGSTVAIGGLLVVVAAEHRIRAPRPEPAPVVRPVLTVPDGLRIRRAGRPGSSPVRPGARPARSRGWRSAGCSGCPT